MNHNLVSGVILAFGLMLVRPKLPNTDILNIEAYECLPIVKQCLIPEDFEYFCRCVEAEAGDQGYIGKCLVADVILNRLEQWRLESLTEVINQEGQFDVVNNGRIWTVEVTEETRKACRDELKKQRRTDILYFCMYRWFDGWAEYKFTWPEDRPWNCHHFYTEKHKK